MRTYVSALLTVVVWSVILDGQAQAPVPGPALSARAGRPFTVAVLRRDGILVPFASLGEDGWRNCWPQAGARHEIPVSVDDAPKGWWLGGTPIATWTAWPMRGERQTITARQVVNFTAQCQRHTGLKTDYRSAELDAPPKMQPFPKDGLATSGDVTIERVEILDDQSADWQRAIEALVKPTTEAETKFLNQTSVRWKHPYPLEQRARTAITLEALYRAPGSAPGIRHFYFEAVKRYPRNPWATAGKACELLTYAVGWIDESPDGKMTASVTVDTSDCNRDGLVYTMPLGAVRTSVGLFWLLQRAAWGYERYDVVEMSTDKKRTVLKTAGGECG
jgi:hypothetical protein